MKKKNKFRVLLLSLCMCLIIIESNSMGKAADYSYEDYPDRMSIYATSGGVAVKNPSTSNSEMWYLQYSDNYYLIFDANYAGVLEFLLFNNNGPRCYKVEMKYKCPVEKHVPLTISVQEVDIDAAMYFTIVSTTVDYTGDTWQTVSIDIPNYANHEISNIRVKGTGSAWGDGDDPMIYIDQVIFHRYQANNAPAIVMTTDISGPTELNPTKSLSASFATSDSDSPSGASIYKNPSVTFKLYRWIETTTPYWDKIGEITSASAIPSTHTCQFDYGTHASWNSNDRLIIEAIANDGLESSTAGYTSEFLVPNQQVSITILKPNPAEVWCNDLNGNIGFIINDYSNSIASTASYLIEYKRPGDTTWNIYEASTWSYSSRSPSIPYSIFATQAGSAWIQITAADGYGSSKTETFEIKVKNEDPIIFINPTSIIPSVVNWGSSHSIQVGVTDPHMSDTTSRITVAYKYNNMVDFVTLSTSASSTNGISSSIPSTPRYYTLSIDPIFRPDIEGYYPLDPTAVHKIRIIVNDGYSAEKFFESDFKIDDSIFPSIDNVKIDTESIIEDSTIQMYYSTSHTVYFKISDTTIRKPANIYTITFDQYTNTISDWISDTEFSFSLDLISTNLGSHPIQISCYDGIKNNDLFNFNVNVVYPSVIASIRRTAENNFLFAAGDQIIVDVDPQIYLGSPNAISEILGINFLVYDANSDIAWEKIFFSLEVINGGKSFRFTLPSNNLFTIPYGKYTLSFKVQVYESLFESFSLDFWIAPSKTISNIFQEYPLYSCGNPSINLAFNTLSIQNVQLKMNGDVRNEWSNIGPLDNGWYSLLNIRPFTDQQWAELPDGLYPFQVVITNNWGYSNTTNFIIIKDATNPSYILDLPLMDSTFNNSCRPQYRLSGTELNLNRYEILIGPWGSPENILYQWMCTTPIESNLLYTIPNESGTTSWIDLVQGTYFFTVKLVDKAGNTQYLSKRFYKDNTLPTIKIVAVNEIDAVGPSLIANSSTPHIIHLNLSQLEEKMQDFYLNPKQWTRNPIQSFEIQAEGFINSVPVSSGYLVVSNSYPSNYIGEIPQYMSFALPDVIWQMNFDGAFTLTFRVTNDVGMSTTFISNAVGSSTKWTFIKDTITPTINCNLFTHLQRIPINNIPTVSFVSSDQYLNTTLISWLLIREGNILQSEYLFFNSGLASTQNLASTFRSDWWLLTEHNDVLNFSAVAFDYTGNKISFNLTFNVDFIYPVFSNMNFTNGMVITDATAPIFEFCVNKDSASISLIRIQISDTPSGVPYIPMETYYPNTLSYHHTTPLMNWNNITDGIWYVKIIAKDSFDQITQIEVMFYKDLLIPEMELLSPLYYGMKTPDLTFEINEQNPVKFEFSLDSVTWKNFMALELTPYQETDVTIPQYYWDLLPGGNSVVNFRLRDIAGKIAIQNITFFKNTTIPQFQMLTPSTNAAIPFRTAQNVSFELYTPTIYPDEISISILSLNSEVDVSTEFSYQNGYIKIITDMTNLWGSSLDAIFTVQIKTRLKLGNSNCYNEYIQNVRIEKDTKLPVFTIDSDDDLTQLFSKENRPQIRLSSAEKDLTYFLAYKNTQSLWNGEIPNDIWLAGNGSLNLNFIAIDELGNQATLSLIVHRDIAGPMLKIITPILNATAGTTSPLFFINVVDTQLSRLWYSLDGGITQISLSLSDIVKGDISGNIDQAAWDKALSPIVILTVYAEDIFGNSNTSTVQIIRTDYVTPPSADEFNRGEELGLNVLYNIPMTMIGYAIGIIGAVVISGLIINKRRQIK